MTSSRRAARFRASAPDLYLMISDAPVSRLVHPDSPVAWELQAKPVDDVPLTASSPHQGVGLLDTVE